MKEIKAYIHNHRIADVIHALKESGQCNANAGTGCRNLSVIPVQSLLKAVDAKEQHYSIDLAEAVINESKLELICEDDQVDELVDIIGRAARTGQAEAGWIYVSDIIQAIPVAGRP
ncbi:MAG: transcriptional regulator [Hydrogenophilales bacterium 28-61-11]|nr:MAG: transcriptional regulator [Hydrogenophilales bacterium 32-62-9]OYY59307.1 MAG: transcriptional regulator [Hydrogenophilales bacterium 28-61-11]OYZ54460.1 MAG: transcriptional regulator [Hydrogenophilales bacterium 16-61-112]OZA41137.1 MAG: transcriptional regulator [Hydrogenophilales bacterium 17-61-76]HQT51732.1 P-II family nitrogen regulator [Acidovorax defluvii]